MGVNKESHSGCRHGNDVKKHLLHHKNSGSRVELRICRLRAMALLLSVGQSVFYLFYKIALVSLASKIFREAIHEFSTTVDEFDAVPVSLINQVTDFFFEAVSNSKTTSLLLMESLSFFEAFAVTVVLVLMAAITMTLCICLSEQYLKHMEIKRLQRILYDKFMLEPNSVDKEEVRDLLYSKMGTIGSFVKDKNTMLDNLTTIIFGLLLLLVLAWDLGLIIFGCTIAIVSISLQVWSKLSSPWAEQCEKKMYEANARLLDLVTCKDVVLSHTMELQERDLLIDVIHSDASEVARLFKAKLVVELFENFTFTMLLPMLFLYVYMTDLSIERVFQLLIVITVMDEMVRAYLSYLTLIPKKQEYQRAQQAFLGVLGMNQDELFPPEFSRYTWFQHGEGNVIDNKRGGDFQRYDSKRRPTLADVLVSKLVHPAQDDKLHLDNVSLGYTRKDGSINKVVEGLNLSFSLGGHYALMGESGAGKSTILKAIVGLIPTLEGCISLSGSPIDPTSKIWREQVAVVSQDSLLFNRTLRENLAYGMSNIEDDDILQALEKVNLKNKVMTLPRGLDTLVEDNGNEFSGGQRQRFQIARILLSSCPIVILDEMTSALDTKTTEDVVREMKSFVAGKTLIMITHHVQTLSLTDNIIEMRRSGEIDTLTNCHRLSQEAGRLSAHFTKNERRRSTMFKGLDTNELEKTEEECSI